MPPLTTDRPSQPEKGLRQAPSETHLASQRQARDFSTKELKKLARRRHSFHNHRHRVVVFCIEPTQRGVGLVCEATASAYKRYIPPSPCGYQSHFPALIFTTLSGSCSLPYLVSGTLGLALSYNLTRTRYRSVANPDTQRLSSVESHISPSSSAYLLRLQLHTARASTL